MPIRSQKAATGPTACQSDTDSTKVPAGSNVFREGICRVRSPRIRNPVPLTAGSSGSQSGGRMQNASHLSTNSPKGASAYAADRGYKGDMCVPVHVEQNSENQRDCTTQIFNQRKCPAAQG